MTDKELLLSKLYDDNTVCYRVDAEQIWIRNQETEFIADWFLFFNIITLSDIKIWMFFESKTGSNYEEISDLTSSILEDHLKRKGFKTYRY